MSKREFIDTETDKRHEAENDAKPRQGDKGDHKSK